MLGWPILCRVLLWLLRVIILLALALGLRAWLIARAVERALRDGEPRRARALLRIIARRTLRPDSAWIALHEVRALFWEGNFDRAMARCDARPSASLTTKIACLMFAERPAEARQLFDAHASTLNGAPYSSLDPTPELLEAMLAFHEEDPTSSKHKLDAFLRDPPRPFTRVAHFYLAALDHKGGRPEKARSELLAARSSPHSFVTRWAEDTYLELYGELPSAPPDAPKKRRWPGLLRDLARGPSILLLRRFALAKADWTYERAVALAAFNLVLLAVLAAVEHSRDAMFEEEGVAMRAAPLLVVPIVAFLATRLLRRADAALRFTCALYCVLPLFVLADWAADRALRETGSVGETLLTVAGYLLAGWLLVVVVVVVLRPARRAGWFRQAFAVAVFGILWLPVANHCRRSPIWWEDRDFTEAGEESKAEDREDVFVATQNARVDAVNATFAPGRVGVTDLYFVGFAGWGEQDVFLHEATFAKNQFDERFDTRGRSAVLANDLSVRDDLPMASKLNLSRVLAHIGTQMNVDDDVLVLLVTSHGDFEGIALREPRRPRAIAESTLTPGDLRDMLTNAGIQWRVVIVSGCKSGVFLPFFQDPHTMIVTASSADRSSFGCAPGRGMTEFGRAVFADTLSREALLPKAFTAAFATIAQREADLHEKPSEPHMFVGKDIEAKLTALSARPKSAPTASASSSSGR